ncbi:MAG: c-type cytochrome [Roseobacter sp.]
MLRFLVTLGLLGACGAAAGLWVTRPVVVTAEALPDHIPDPVQGEAIFYATGCASCHAAPGAQGDAKLVLAGGMEFKTEFGVFHAPNISTDRDVGLGAWTDAEFVSAVQHGTSPSGEHYYPAFPYASYSRMETTDILDLKSFMDTLPADATPSRPHDLSFPFNIRMTLGAWKLLYVDPEPVFAQTDPLLARGQYLVEAMGHCSECHTPRNALGGPILSQWMAGGANPDGEGKIPNITPWALDWVETDIAYYLETGFTPDFDSAGGSMVAVIENTAKLSPEDRSAIAAYLKAIPAVASQ